MNELPLALREFFRWISSDPSRPLVAFATYMLVRRIVYWSWRTAMSFSSRETARTRVPVPAPSGPVLSELGATAPGISLTNALSRFRARFEASAADLLTGSVCLADMTSDPDTPIPDSIARMAVRQMLSQRQDLRSTPYSSTLLIYTQPTPAARESASFLLRWMPWRSRRERQVERLACSRAVLAQRARELRHQAASLEAEEQCLRSRAVAESSTAGRRRLVTQLCALRHDLERKSAIERVVTTQINVINSHLHNLAISFEQGAGIPDSEELAGGVAEAESAVETIRERADISDASSKTISTILGDSEDELAALMRELEAGSEPVERGASSRCDLGEHTQLDPPNTETPVDLSPVADSMSPACDARRGQVDSEPRITSKLRLAE